MLTIRLCIILYTSTIDSIIRSQNHTPGWKVLGSMDVLNTDIDVANSEYHIRLIMQTFTATNTIQAYKRVSKRMLDCKRTFDLSEVSKLITYHIEFRMY